MSGPKDLTLFNDMVKDIFQSIGESIGNHVMFIVLEHALWKTNQKFEEAALITISHDGVVLDGLGGLEPEKARLVAQEFITAIVSTLGRLVGIQIAEQLAGQLDILGGN